MASSRAADRLRVAMFTPLPPARSGIADYASALIPELAKVVDLEVFDRLPRRFPSGPFDAILYQMGNNDYHADIYCAALDHPGIVVLHEPNLHDLVRSLAAGSAPEYLSEVGYEIFGEELKALWTGDGLLAQPQPRVFTMVRRLLSRSNACIVHSRFAEDEVRMKGFQGPLARIPHGAALATPDAGAYRRRLGIPPDEPLVGIFGHQRPDKQSVRCLDVFHRLVQEIPDAHLLVVGQLHQAEPLAEHIAVLGLENRVHLLGYVPLEDFDGYLSACDVVLNLRWPTFGETSGTLMRALGLGKTVIVSDVGSFRELDDEICVRIPCDELQEQVLLECIKWLLSDRGIRDEIGRSARDWVSRTCTWKRVARSYADFLRSVARAPAREMESPLPIRANEMAQSLLRWVPPEPEKERYFEEQKLRLVRMLQLIPSGGAEDRILEMGCYMQITPALRYTLGYGEVCGCYLGKNGSESRVVESREGHRFQCQIDLFDAEFDCFPYPSNHFRAVICGELLEHLQSDPMHMMHEIHRVLRPDGVLVLTTPNVVSLRAVASVLRGSHPAFHGSYPRPLSAQASERRHAREYTPPEVSRLLTDAGFLILHIETGPYRKEEWDLDWAEKILKRGNFAAHLRGECIYAVGRKAAIARQRYPDWLYHV